VFSALLCNKDKMMSKIKTKFIMEKPWKKIESLLNVKGFKTVILDNDKSLKQFIYDIIPDNCIVGLVNSLSTNALRIKDILLEKGNKVYCSWNGGTYNRSIDTFEELPQPDFFLTTADSISPKGELINAEYSSNAAFRKSFPKNIIAFSAINRINKKLSRIKEKSQFVIFDKKSNSTEFTVAVLPFLNLA
jgi:hypothetical protein